MAMARYRRDAPYLVSGGLGTAAGAYIGKAIGSDYLRYYGWNRPSVSQLKTAGKLIRSGVSRANRAYKSYSKGGAAPLKSRSSKSGKRRRAPRRKSPRKISKDISRINRKLKLLSQHDDATLGTLVHRDMAASHLAIADNKKASAVLAGTSATIMDESLSHLKFFDPSVPGTLITGDLGVANYQNNVLFESVSSSVLCRNNYKTDCRVKIYLCCVKDDTSKSPTDCWDDGITDASNVADRTVPNQFPTDYEVLTDLWSLKLLNSCVLSPGQSVKASHTIKNIEYSTSTVDVQTDTYQREYKSFRFMVVAEGTLSHDNTLATENGLGQCGLDILSKRTSVVKYSAGVNIKYYIIENTLDTPTNYFAQSHQPISGNVAYGIAT